MTVRFRSGFPLLCVVTSMVVQAWHWLWFRYHDIIGDPFNAVGAMKRIWTDFWQQIYSLKLIKSADTYLKYKTLIVRNKMASFNLELFYNHFQPLPAANILILSHSNQQIQQGKAITLHTVIIFQRSIGLSRHGNPTHVDLVIARRNNWCLKAVLNDFGCFFS